MLIYAGNRASYQTKLFHFFTYIIFSLPFSYITQSESIQLMDGTSNAEPVRNLKA